LPTFRQLPWPCDPGAMNGSLLCPVALVFPTRQQADLAAHLAHRELIIGVPSDPSRCAASPLIWEGRRTRSGAAWWVSQERGRAASARPGTPSYRFWALKVSPGSEHHAIVTCDGQRIAGQCREAA
jgi:hypothetical protein